ncbi:MAG: hypothetical protein AB2369_10235, partial [Clostridium sp.]
METVKLANKQKRLDIDLYIIAITALVVLGIYTGFQDKIIIFIKNKNIHILLRTFISALFQFGIAGLGITIVSLLRKESFLSYGLKYKGAALSILFSVLCFVPY